MRLFMLAFLVGEQTMITEAWQSRTGSRFSLKRPPSSFKQQRHSSILLRKGSISMSTMDAEAGQQQLEAQKGRQQAYQSPRMAEDPGVSMGDLGNGYDSERDACGVGFVVQPGRSTHDVVTRALRALGCMEHRGACAADNVSGDGAGVLTEIPWEIIAADTAAVAEEMAKMSTISKNNKAKRLASKALLGVGQMFLDRDPEIRKQIKGLVAEVSRSGKRSVGTGGSSVCLFICLSFCLFFQAADLSC